MTVHSDVIIVGAGPYGLSLAAHLQQSDVGFRIFGSPMHTWRECMPTGMLLKSDGFASNIFDPGATFTLERFCELNRIPYDHTRVPVSLETFRQYGMAFQQRIVPQLEDQQVTQVERDGDVYRFQLSDGTMGRADNVVLAVGISHFHYVPPVLAGLPSDALTHSSAHRDLGRFGGRDVTVVGAGASAIDTAVLLSELGGRVTLIARRSSLRFGDPPSGVESIWKTVIHPRSPIGPGWKARLLSDAPWLFHRLPDHWRLRIVSNWLGPAAGWPMKERFVRVPALLGYEIEAAEFMNGKVRLSLQSKTGPREHVTDHVIAATGYRTDLRRLTFLSGELLSAIRSVRGTPALSPNFESSIPGLYFVGMASMYSFGPLMRFACGAHWAAKRIAKTLKRDLRAQVKSVASDAGTPRLNQAEGIVERRG
jgi:thioredoxin reductase